MDIESKTKWTFYSEKKHRNSQTQSEFKAPEYREKMKKKEENVCDNSGFFSGQLSTQFSQRRSKKGCLKRSQGERERERERERGGGKKKCFTKAKF